VIAKCIEVNGVLTSLNVGYNDLNEEAALGIVRAARQQDKMASLGLASCKIGPSEAQDIADYVRVSSVLTSLNLFFNKIGDEGAKAIGEALRVNSALTEVRFPKPPWARWPRLLFSRHPCIARAG
jgi:hypothetical protein